jgi:hypothetical protein
MRTSGENNIILLNEFNKTVMNLHDFNILFITYQKNRQFEVKKNHLSLTRLKCNANI